MQILVINPEKIKYKNILYYIDKFSSDASERILDLNKKKTRKNKEKIKLLIENLNKWNSWTPITESKPANLLKFFKKSYEIINESLNETKYGAHSLNKIIFSLIRIFIQSRVISLDLLHYLENNLKKVLPHTNKQDFFKLLIFYAQCPLGIYPTYVKDYIMSYIRNNFRDFDDNSLIALSLAILQIGFNYSNDSNKLFEIFLFVDHEIWGTLMNRILSHRNFNSPSTYLFKLYLFAKLANFDNKLRNPSFTTICEKYATKFSSFENRIVSKIQRRLAEMLDQYKKDYVLEPPLIEDVFAVDYLMEHDKKPTIIEINGPTHYWTVVWEKDNKNIEIQKMMEEKSEIWDKENKFGIMNTRYTEIKSNILKGLGYEVFNISYLDMKKYDTSEKLHHFFLDFLAIKNKKILKDKFF